MTIKGAITRPTISRGERSIHSGTPLTKNDLMRIGSLLAVPVLVAGCALPPDITPTPFVDNKPKYTATPEYSQFTTDAAWLSIFNKLGTSFQKELGLLEKAIPDPFIRNRVAEVLIGNRIASMKGGDLSMYSMLLESGKVIGMEACADSRIVCKTSFYSASEGATVISEQRALGAAPRVFDKGINVSILATHANTCNETGGCGALAALAELKKGSKGYDELAKHVSPDTIKLIQSSLHNPNPDEQAVIGAKIQAIINSNAHGGDGHITVAVKMGHADGSMTVLGAFDQNGNAVPIPKVVEEYIAFNTKSPLMVDPKLAAGQAPVESVINTTRFPTAKLMDSLVEQPGHTFKISLRPQTGDPRQIINALNIEDGVATANYPLAHPQWGKIQWVIGRTPEETALIRESLLKSDKMEGFLGKQGVIVEAVVNDAGEITELGITQMAQGSKGIQSVDKLKAMGGLVNVEVALSQKTLAEAELLVAGNTVSKSKPIVEALKKVGKAGIQVFKRLAPLFDAGMIISAIDAYKEWADMDMVYDSHALIMTSTKDGKNALSGGLDNGGFITTDQYNTSLRDKPNLEPLMLNGNFGTTYTQQQFADSYFGSISDFITEASSSGGNTIVGSKNPNSKYFGVSLGDLQKMGKVLVFDHKDITDPVNPHKKYMKPGLPLVFLPMSVETSTSPKYWDLTKEGIGKHPFMIVNSDTGEFLTTVTPGEMIVPVESLTPRNPAVKVTYFLQMKSDGEGRITVKAIGYKEEPIKTGGLSDDKIAESGSTPVNGLFGHIFPKKESVSVS